MKGTLLTDYQARLPEELWPRYLARYRVLLGVFIIGLVVSGLTAFPLRAELAGFAKFIGVSAAPHW